MRLIDADYIKIRLCEIADYWRSKGKRYEAVLLNDTVNAVIDSESTITQPSGEWISVEDRLPKTGTVLATDGKVVITAPSSSVTLGGAITHWMPLPEPPEDRESVR